MNHATHSALVTPTCPAEASERRGKLASEGRRSWTAAALCRFSLLLGLTLNPQLSTLNCHADSVTFNTADITGSLLNRQITVIPDQKLDAFGHVIYGGIVQTLNPTNGVAVATLNAGRYCCQIQGIEVQFCINVANTGTNQVNAADITDTSTVSTFQGLLAWSKAASDYRYAYAATNSGTAGQVLTTDGTNNYWTTASGGGGGGGTNALLASPDLLTGAASSGNVWLQPVVQGQQYYLQMLDVQASNSGTDANNPPLYTQWFVAATNQIIIVTASDPTVLSHLYAVTNQIAFAGQVLATNLWTTNITLQGTLTGGTVKGIIQGTFTGSGTGISNLVAKSSGTATNLALYGTVDNPAYAPLTLMGVSNNINSGNLNLGVIGATSGAIIHATNYEGKAMDLGLWSAGFSSTYGGKVKFDLYDQNNPTTAFGPGWGISMFGKYGAPVSDSGVTDHPLISASSTNGSLDFWKFVAGDGVGTVSGFHFDAFTGKSSFAAGGVYGLVSGLTNAAGSADAFISDVQNATNALDTTTAQSANKIKVGPSSGSAAVPTFRYLTGADLAGGGDFALTAHDNTTNYWIDANNAAYQARDLAGDFCLTLLTNGPGSVSIKLTAGAANRSFLFPTNFNCLGTNGLTVNGTNYIGTVTNGQRCTWLSLHWPSATPLSTSMTNVTVGVAYSQP